MVLAEAKIEQLVWHNPIDFFAQSGRLNKADLEHAPGRSVKETFEGNSVLRGQDPEKYEVGRR